MDPQVNKKKPEIGQRGLYKLGAIAAFLAALLFRRNWSAEATVIFSVDFPATALEWFTLLRDNWLLGIIMLDFADLVNHALVGIIFFTLYYALKDITESYMRFAYLICVVGITVSFVSNHAFTLLSLSDQYFAASTTDRPIFLAAGEAILALNNQGSGSSISIFLIGLAGLMISIIMVQSQVFSRRTAWFGIIANGVGLSYFITIIISPTWGWLPIPLSAIPLMIWYILIGIKLYKLSQEQ